MTIGVTLLGCDGSTWNLSAGDSGAILSDGIGGLHLPKVTQLWSKTAHRPGQQWRGSRLESRSFTMKVIVGDVSPPFRTGADWIALDDSFWQALSTDDTSQLVVNGRTLTFRLDDGNDQGASTLDPSLAGSAVYTIDCIADRPEWVGPPVTATFGYQAAVTTNFFGDTSGLGPPFYIVDSSLFNTASVSNPGDLPAYPVWQITGPVTTATVGVGSQTVTLPFALQAGETVTIDADRQTITDSQGNNLWPRMGYTPVEFAPIPGGGLVPIDLGMAGANVGSSVSVSLTPLYRRAW